MNRSVDNTAGPPVRPSVVYVLTCSERDCYAEMAAVSATLLRGLYPAANVWLLADELTDQYLQQRRPPIMDLCDHYVPVTTGMTAPRERAWSIKSRMRQLVPGDFVFLDVDALPVRHFHSIFETPCDFAAVLDRHDPPEKYDPAEDEKKLYAKLNWRFPPRYYNSGVILFRDTPGAHRLGEEWANRWVTAWREGEVADQYSLNSALADVDVKIATLPAKYNAQVTMRRWVARGAAIIHPFTVGISESADTVLGRAVHHLKQTGRIDMAALKRFQETGYPWADENWIGGQIAVGRYGRAMGILCRRLTDAAKRGGVRGVIHCLQGLRADSPKG